MLEGAHSLGRERASGSRAAPALLRELSVLGVGIAAAVCAATIGACDQGVQHDQQPLGPHLQIANVSTEPTRTVAADGVIQIAFDRFLLPSTVIRQSFSLRDASDDGLTPIVRYDPVARVVTLSNPNPGGGAWLTPGVAYKVIIGVPQGDDDSSGPRAIDRATLDPAGQPYVYGFQAKPADGTPDPDRQMDFCTDVIPIFQFRCSGGSCHGAPIGTIRPAEGLILQTSDGIAHTAIGRPSQEANTGARAIAEPPGPLFGVDMPIVDPGSPGDSWLMYKVLLGDVRPIDQGLDAGVPTCPMTGGPRPRPVFQLASPMIPLAEDERARLANLMIGNQMPYPLNLAGDQQTPVTEDPATDERSALPMTFEELERVRAWIAQGAHVDECGACPQ